MRKQSLLEKVFPYYTQRIINSPTVSQEKQPPHVHFHYSVTLEFIITLLVSFFLFFLLFFFFLLHFSVLIKFIVAFFLLDSE